VPYEDNGFLKDPSIAAAKGRNKEGGGRLISIFPLTIITAHLDSINIRYARPIGPDQVEVQYAYFAHQNDDPELLRPRIRQSSNLQGPSGLISFDDANVFLRMDNAQRRRQQ